VEFRSSRDEKKTGVIFDIKHFAVHDGPGIRTTIFFKGCPLRCLWCHSPESQNIKPELAFYSELCIGCGVCVDSCPNNAQTKRRPKILYEKCEITGRCVEACYSEALVIYGTVKTISDIIFEVEKDYVLYEKSGGGITLSGGEPTSQPAFSAELLKTLKKQGYNTALDTCGHAPWRMLKALLKNVDVILYDVKHMDFNQHKRLTTVSNEIILSNLKKINSQASFRELIIRVPVIPDYNDSRKNFMEMSNFFADLGNVSFIELLPYHNFGVHKYTATGRQYQLEEVKSPSAERLNYLRGILEENGLIVKTEGWKDGE
jgi:pyruvate formate lyase activating enzyme